jgi:hypothetical protein
MYVLFNRLWYYFVAIVELVLRLSNNHSLVRLEHYRVVEFEMLNEKQTPQE